MYYKINYDDELVHHGILGQRWGFRRYQNEDGSLTEAGKQRYGTDGNASSNKDETGSQSPSKKNVSEMSDEELQSAVKRLQMEKTYKELTLAQSQKKQSEGKKIVMGALKDSGKKALSALMTYAFGSVLNAVFQDTVMNDGKKPTPKSDKNSKKTDSKADLTTSTGKEVTYKILNNTNFGLSTIGSVTETVQTAGEEYVLNNAQQSYELK